MLTTELHAAEHVAMRIGLLVAPATPQRYRHKVKQGTQSSARRRESCRPGFEVRIYVFPRSYERGYGARPSGAQQGCRVFEGKALSKPAAVPGSGYTKLWKTPKSSINRAESGAGAPRSKNFFSNPSQQGRRE